MKTILQFLISKIIMTIILTSDSIIDHISLFPHYTFVAIFFIFFLFFTKIEIIIFLFAVIFPQWSFHLFRIFIFSTMTTWIIKTYPYSGATVIKDIIITSLHSWAHVSVKLNENHMMMTWMLFCWLVKGITLHLFRILKLGIV